MISRTTPCVALGALLLSFSPAAGAAQTAIAAGQTVSGQLAQGDPRASDDTYYDDFAIQAAAGQRLVITVRSPDFDTYLLWGAGSGSAFRGLESDDDGAGGTDSRLEVTAPSSGRFTIRVNALSEGMQGRYTLSVQSAGASRPTPSGGGSGGRFIAAGETVSGRLEASDSRLDDDSYYDLYVYRGRPGERIVVTMRSSAFDTYLSGGSVRGTAFEQRDSNDDGAGGTDSRLEASVGSDGTYAIRANSLAAGQTGSYTLSVASSGAVAQRPGGARPGTLAVGQTVAGSLDSGDPRLAADNSSYEQFVIRGAAGEQVIITMTSSAFDAYLRGGHGEGSQFELQHYDDDSGGGTNARLQVALDGRGSYTVQANALRAGMTGAYQLSVERAGGAAPTPRGTTVSLGQTVNGRLDSSDPMLADESYYDHYVFRGTPGQQVVITMTSSAFDAYLTWGRANGSTLVAEGSDDDSGGGTNAQVLATVGPNGTLLVQANSLRARETGSYTLSFAGTGGQAPTRNIPAGAATVTAGQSVSGALARSDRMLGDSSYFDQFVYTGSPGDRLRITLTSSDFDAYLQWGRLSADRVAVEASDDDGAGGTNARLEVTVGGTGTYVIRANSLTAQQTGSYTLAVQRMAASTAPVPGTSTGPSSGGEKWRYSYANPNTPAFRTLEQRMKQAQLLELFSNQLSTQFPLPANTAVDLRLAQCGQVNAYYSPRERAVTFCYELLQHLANTFVRDGQWTAEQRETVNGAFNFIMMHEVGHALVHVMDLPVTGREEDAVDQLATVMLINSGDKGAQAAMAGVLAIQPGENAVFDNSDFADEHSLGPQRLFNVACWIYGSDPQKYQGLVSRGTLPRERAVRCPGEYERLSKAWMRLLGR